MFQVSTLQSNALLFLLSCSYKPRILVFEDANLLVIPTHSSAKPRNVTPALESKTDEGDAIGLAGIV